jgi:hypothetical protein
MALGAPRVTLVATTHLTETPFLRGFYYYSAVINVGEGSIMLKPSVEVELRAFKESFCEKTNPSG